MLDHGAKIAETAAVPGDVRVGENFGAERENKFLRIWSGGRECKLSPDLKKIPLRVHQSAPFPAIFSERSRSLYAIARPSVCLSSVCL